MGLALVLPGHPARKKEQLMAYSARILADSLAPSGRRLTTFEVTFPRIVLAEFNTHRMLSRNSASSRAIPVEKRIAAVEADPFVPESFGRNQRGMQAASNLEGLAAEQAEQVWRESCRRAIHHARAFAEIGVHKQLANRLIEPFCWHTVIVSATEWQNFFNLRCHPAAQPEIRRIAEMMRDLYESGDPIELDIGEWHLPLVFVSEQKELDPKLLPLVSAGRCARVSYLTHDGRRDPAEDVKLANRLQADGHMSPFEHPAQAIERPDRHGNFVGWFQLRKTFPGEAVFSGGVQP